LPVAGGQNASESNGWAKQIHQVLLFLLSRQIIGRCLFEP